MAEICDFIEGDGARRRNTAFPENQPLTVDQPSDLTDGALPSPERQLSNLFGEKSERAPVCLECGGKADLVSGDRIYPHRRDLYHKPFWLCRCGAYCGCHDGTTRPLGHPCGPQTRKARSAAHAAFDPIWRSGSMSRNQAYKALAERLGIRRSVCHIGMMDEATALRVPEIARTLTPARKDQPCA